MKITPTVSVIMGRKSDLKTMAESIKVLQKFDIPHEVRIMSTHRKPKVVLMYGSSIKQRQIKVIIAGAGKTANLAGMIASLTTVPVIGVPIETSGLSGLDSLLSTVQMPAGIPVATTAIGKDGAKNAALLAVSILGIFDRKLSSKLKSYRRELEREATQEDTEVRKTINE